MAAGASIAHTDQVLGTAHRGQSAHTHRISQAEAGRGLPLLEERERARPSHRNALAGRKRCRSVAQDVRPRRRNHRRSRCCALERRVGITPTRRRDPLAGAGVSTREREGFRGQRPQRSRTCVAVRAVARGLVDLGKKPSGRVRPQFRRDADCRSFAECSFVAHHAVAFARSSTFRRSKTLSFASFSRVSTSRAWVSKSSGRAVLQVVEALRNSSHESAPSLTKQFVADAQNALIEQGAAATFVTGRDATAHDSVSADGLSVAISRGRLKIAILLARLADNLGARRRAACWPRVHFRCQTFLQTLMAQEDALRLCDGVLFVYRESAASAITASFQFARRVFGIKRPDVWSAVLDLAPLHKERVPIRSPNLMTIDCRSGFDLSKLGVFFEHLRANGGAAMQGAARHA